jgi:hypothetical protein
MSLFFVAVGMSVDVAALAQHPVAVRPACAGDHQHQGGRALCALPHLRHWPQHGAEGGVHAFPGWRVRLRRLRSRQGARRHRRPGLRDGRGGHLADHAADARSGQARQLAGDATDRRSAHHSPKLSLFSARRRIRSAGGDRRLRPRRPHGGYHPGQQRHPLRRLRDRCRTGRQVAQRGSSRVLW